MNQRYNSYHFPSMMSNWYKMWNRTHHRVLSNSFKVVQWAIPISFKNIFHIHPILYVALWHEINSPQSFQRNGDPEGSTLSQFSSLNFYQSHWTLTLAFARHDENNRSNLYENESPLISRW